MDRHTRAAIDSFVQHRQLGEERLYLELFRERIYPVYAEHGFSFQEAVVAYRLGAIERDTAALRCACEEDDDDPDGGG